MAQAKPHQPTVAPTPQAAPPIWPAWRTLAALWNDGTATDAYGPTRLAELRPLDSATDRNSDAEYAFSRLHGRFLRWADEYLFADERLLAFVPWSASASDDWWQRARRRVTPGARQPREGVLAVTDSATLFLRDAADPAGGAMYWGYTVQALPHERLAAVHAAAQPGGRVALTLDLAASGTRETTTWVFGPAVAVAARQAAGLLECFLPQPGDRRLRARGRVRAAPRLLSLPPETSGRQRRSMADLVTDADRAALKHALRELLAAFPAPDGTPRRVHAQALRLGDERPPSLLAVTQEHVFVVPLPSHGPVEVYALAGITSVELRRSVLGHHIAWGLGAGEAGAPRRRIVPFPPLALPACFTLFAAFRQALALLSAQAQGPDVPEDEPDAASAATDGKE